MDRDFDSLAPRNVRDVQTSRGTMRVGELEDGTIVKARPWSSDGRPTLEFRNPINQRGSEIRYNP